MVFCFNGTGCWNGCIQKYWFGGGGNLTPALWYGWIFQHPISLGDCWPPMRTFFSGGGPWREYVMCYLIQGGYFTQDEEYRNPHLHEEANATSSGQRPEGKYGFCCWETEDEGNQHWGNEKPKSPFCRVEEFAPVIGHNLLFHGGRIKWCDHNASKYFQ